MTELKPCRYPVHRLLPHEPPMLLLDEVLGWNAERIVAAVTVRPDSLFLDDNGMPAHIAIEWMAQACGAWVGVQALEALQPVRIGFLLGTRDFKSRISRYGLGDRIAITAGVVFNDGQMAVFDCEVVRDGESCATARLNVFQPTDLDAMLKEQGVTMQKNAARP
jgi:predicted hotdog family 3-hydroxylacyl-ACP dehydratase